MTEEYIRPPDEANPTKIHVLTFNELELLAIAIALRKIMEAEPNDQNLLAGAIPAFKKVSAKMRPNGK